MSILVTLGRSLKRRKVLLIAACAVCAAAAVAAPASGAPTTSSSVQAIVNVVQQVKSVTVSPTSIQFNSCTSSNGTAGTQLTFPNGSCVGSSGITVSTNNATVPESIFVQGAPALPSDSATGGTPWVLTPSNATLGQDVYALKLQGSSGVFLGPGAAPDLNIGSGGIGVQPNTNVSESPTLYGPSGSTDPSTQFTTTVTWIAS